MSNPEYDGVSRAKGFDDYTIYNKCSGFNGLMRLRQVSTSEGEESTRRATERLVEIIEELIRMGPERGVAKDNLVRLVEDYMETRETVQARKLYAVRVHCTQGRHRTIMIIGEGTKIVEALGGSWTVWYHSLYVGVPEFNWDRKCTVSYTHLTLPTKRIV